MTPLQRFVVWLVVLHASISYAQNKQSDELSGLKNLSIERFQYDGFRMMLLQAGLHSQTDLKAVLSRPKQNILIILGRANGLKKVSHQIYDFYHSGGSVLIASDHGDNAVTKHFPVQLLQFDEFSCRYGKKDRYKNFVDCPIVTQFKTDHPLFDGVQQLVANRPGHLFLKHRHSDGMNLAALPTNFIDKAETLMYSMEKRGRFLAISDHSFFVNEMLVHKDNARFLLNCVIWLGENGQRKKFMLIRDEKVYEDYKLGQALANIPLSEIMKRAGKIPPVGPKVTDSSLRVVVNHFLTSLEDKNIFNEALANQPKGVKHGVVYRIAAIVGLVFVVLLLLRWLIRAQISWWKPLHSADIGPAFQKLISGHSPNERRQGMRLMVVNLFSNFLPETVMDAKSLETPNIEVRLPINKRNATKRGVQRLWNIAIGRTDPKCRRRDVQRLEQKLEYLQALHDEGKLKLEW